MGKARFSLHVAVYLMLIQDNSVLLMRRYNTDWQNGKYTLIAGHVDGGETIPQAMAREAQEEAGIIIKPEDLRVVHVMHQMQNNEYVDFYLVPDVWDGKPEIKEVDKADDLQWFQLQELPENLLPNVKKVLEEYKKGNFFSEFTW